MKKNIILPLLALSLVVALAGCSVNKKDISNTGKGAAEVDRGIGEGIPSGPRRPDFGQPDRSPDSSGIVKSIVGNEITILKVDGGFGRRSSSTTAGAALEDGDKKDSPAVSLTGSVAGRPGGMGMGMGGGQGGREPGSGDRTAMLEALKEMSTGEETIIIPVGIQMLKAADSNGGRREMVEASLSDISSDKTLMIWLNASSTDKKIAEFVLIN